jgi:hypothetical protein
MMRTSKEIDRSRREPAEQRADESAPEMSVSQRLTQELGRANEKRTAIDASISQGNADLLSLDAADDGARKAARDNIRALSDERAEWD